MSEPTTLAKATVAFIEIELVAGPAISTSGNIGDVHLAVGMIDSAIDAIESMLARESVAGLVLPNNYVLAMPNEKVYPLVAEGDRAVPSPEKRVEAPVPTVARVRLEMQDSGSMKLEGGELRPKSALKLLREARKGVVARLGRPSILEPHGAGLPAPVAVCECEPLENAVLFPIHTDSATGKTRCARCGKIMSSSTGAPTTRLIT